MLLNRAVHHGQPKAGVPSVLLGGKEGLEDPRQHIECDSPTIVHNGQLDMRARRSPQLGCLFAGQMNQSRSHLNGALLLNRFGGIETQVGQQMRNLSRVANDPRFLGLAGPRPGSRVWAWCAPAGFRPRRPRRRRGNGALSVAPRRAKLKMLRVSAAPLRAASEMSAKSWRRELPSVVDRSAPEAMTVIVPSTLFMSWATPPASVPSASKLLRLAQLLFQFAPPFIAVLVFGKGAFSAGQGQTQLRRRPGSGLA
jgi:hypothetical protein